MNLRKSWFTLVEIAYDLFLKLNPRKLAANAVITNEAGQVLVLRSRYAGTWSLPGGGLDHREHLDAAAVRECREELGVDVAVDAFTGFYYYADHSSYVGIFRCRIVSGGLRLSHEHSEYRWVPVDELQGRMGDVVRDALGPAGQAVLRTFA